MWRPWVCMGHSVVGNETVAETGLSVVKNFGSVACNSGSVAQKVLSVAESMKY